MDYKKFLNRKETQILPYFGGARVDARERQLRARFEPEPGWWQFEIEGRFAVATAAVEAPDMTDRPQRRGHFFDNRIFISGREIRHVNFVPRGACDNFAPCVAREWYQGQLIFEAVDFDDDAELNVRHAYEKRESLAGMKGIPASLRAAYGWASVRHLARQKDVPVSIREVWNELGRFATGGDEVIRQRLAEIVERREREQAQRLVRQAEYEHRERRRRRTDPEKLEDDVGNVLERAGARLLNLFGREGNLAEVTFNYMEERFRSLIDATSFQVIDAGICLEGTDRELNLSSLPGVIREAINTGVLYITWR